MIMTFAEDAISLSYFVAACIMLCIATLISCRINICPVSSIMYSRLLLLHYLKKKAKYLWNCCFIAVLYQSVIENIQNQCLQKINFCCWFLHLQLPNLHMLIKQESITCEKCGSWDFQQIANSVLNKGKSSIHPLFNGSEVLSSASDKANFFAKIFSVNSNLDD